MNLPRRFLQCTLIFAIGFAAIQALSQDPNPKPPPPAEPLSPQQLALNEALRALIKATPLLPMDRVELKIDPPMVLGFVSAVTADAAGNIYVLHRPENPTVDAVVVIDSQGRFIRSFGRGLYAMAHGIRVDPDGNVWTADAHTSMVYKFSPQGKKLLEISVGGIPDPARPFCGTTDVAFNKAGHVFISDGYCNGRVLEYAADGAKIGEWGKKGEGPGEFHIAHAIVMGNNGTLYVADRENGRLEWFDQHGKFLGEKRFGGQLFSVAISKTGDLYVGARTKGAAGDVDAAVFKFDPASGKVLGRVDALAHELSVAPDGSLLPGPVNVKEGVKETTTSILVFRPRK